MNIRMMTGQNRTVLKNSRKGGFSLAEVVMAVFVSMLLFGGMINAYINVTRNAQWAGFSLAAQALATQTLEQARSGVWDPTIPKNEVSNMVAGLNSYSYSSGVATGYSWTNLDIPVNGGNYVRATNFVTLSSVPGLPSGVSMQMIQINTVWPFTRGTTTILYTNTVVTYMAPDNESVSSL
jgi:hypothetical protein